MQLIVQIVLARLLAPSDFGAIAIVIVVVNVLNVFVQSGLNTALVQAKAVSKTDCDTVFWISIIIAAVAYGFAYTCAPLLASFYNIECLTALIRVVSLLAFVNALNSVQIALATRSLKTKRIFDSTIVACLVSGASSVTVAFLGGGVWSLAVQALLFQLVSAFVLFSSSDWHPGLNFSISRGRALFSFGWKILASSLINAVYQGMYDLVIGKVFSASQLGLYSQGKKIPQIVCNIFDSAMRMTLISVSSRFQDDRESVKSIMKRAMTSSLFIVVPLLTMLLVCGNSLIPIVFGQQWTAAVPYMQVLCLSFMLWPIHTSNLQVINAIGRSDVYLKLELMKKLLGVVILIMSVVFFDDLIYVVFGSLVAGVVGVFMNASPCKKLLDYSIAEQAKDCLPIFLIAGASGLVAYLIGLAVTDAILCMCLQAVTFVLFYFMLARLFKISAFAYSIDLLSRVFKKE